MYDTHGAYLDSPRNVAKEMGVAFIDMNKITHDLVQGLGPAESKKLFMFVEPEKVPAFPKGREDNTHLNVYGARTIAGLTVDAIAKEIPELAKYVRHYDYVVAQDGTGDFFTVQEAINAVPIFARMCVLLSWSVKALIKRRLSVAVHAFIQMIAPTCGSPVACARLMPCNIRVFLLYGKHWMMPNNADTAT